MQLQELLGSVLCFPSSSDMAEAERPNHEQQYGHTQERQEKGLRNISSTIIENS
jgi:hypothetical protein